MSQRKHTATTVMTASLPHVSDAEIKSMWNWKRYTVLYMWVLRTLNMDPRHPEEKPKARQRKFHGAALT